MRPADSIAALGLAVTRESIHLAWGAAIAGAPGAAPSYRTFYAHGETGGRSWSAPFEIDDTLGAPRLVAAGERVSLVTGLRLLAFTSRDAGRSWDAPVSLLPAGARKVATFDAALDGDDLVVACVVQPPTPYDPGERTADHEQRVVVVRLAPGGATSEIELGRFAPSLLAPGRPRLAAAGGRLRLAVGLNQDGGGAVVRERPLLLWFDLDPGSGAWSPAKTIDLAAGGGELDRIDTLAFVSAGGATHLFTAGRALHVVSTTGDGRSSPPRRLNPYETRLSRGELRAPAVAAALAGGQVRVAWIDHRNRTSERRAWNPLGGLPWSDDNPFGIDSDVFSLPWPASSDLPASASPERLTPPSSFAAAVEVAPAGDGFLVAWAGRTGVGKEPGSGDAPRIFLTSLPVHGTGSTNQPPS